ncbi:MAG: hypothetical protein LBL90_03700 [Prevotellaceae bacterium]|jgi:hypothetical protein|nr:hypothetical protein [Prevotellaceae bacterium]
MRKRASQGAVTSSCRKCILKKIDGLSRGTRCPRELERARTIHELRPLHRFAVFLEASWMARSTFYYHLHTFMQANKYAREKEKIRSLYHEHKERYGYRSAHYYRDDKPWPRYKP